MKVVFCVDYTPSMSSYFIAIRAMIMAICPMIFHTQGDVRIGVVKFRSVCDVWNTLEHGFTTNINVLEQWLNSDEPGGVTPDGYEAVGKKK